MVKVSRGWRLRATDNQQSLRVTPRLRHLSYHINMAYCTRNAIMHTSCLAKGM